MIRDISKSLPEMLSKRGTQRRTKFTSFSAAAWEVSTLRVGLIKQIIGERPMVLCIDETGDAKGKNH